MRTLVLGVNGFIGRATAAALTERGHAVYGVSRSASPDTPVCGTYVSCDRTASDRIREVVARWHVDAVVDCLAMTLSTTRPLLSCLDGAIGHYVMLSSADVYRNYELLHRRADWTATYARIADVMRWPGEIDISEDPDHPMARRLRHLDLSVPLLIDSSAIRRRVGYVEPVPLLEGLVATVAAEPATDERLSP